MRRERAQEWARGPGRGRAHGTRLRPAQDPIRGGRDRQTRRPAPGSARGRGQARSLARLIRGRFLEAVRTPIWVRAPAPGAGWLRAGPPAPRPRPTPCGPARPIRAPAPAAPEVPVPTSPVPARAAPVSEVPAPAAPPVVVPAPALPAAGGRRAGGQEAEGRAGAGRRHPLAMTSPAWVSRARRAVLAGSRPVPMSKLVAGPSVWRGQVRSRQPPPRADPTSAGNLPARAAGRARPGPGSGCGPGRPG